MSKNSFCWFGLGAKRGQYHFGCSSFLFLQTPNEFVNYENKILYLIGFFFWVKYLPFNLCFFLSNLKVLLCYLFIHTIKFITFVLFKLQCFNGHAC